MTRSRTRWASACLVGLSLALSPSVSWAAQPSIVVTTDVSGACPSHAELDAALVTSFQREVARGTGERFVLQVREADGKVSMFLKSSEGEQLVERTIASHDCRSVAEAIAIIVYTHFVVLGLETPPPVTATERAPAKAQDPSPGSAVPSPETPPAVSSPPQPAPPVEPLLRPEVRRPRDKSPARSSRTTPPHDPIIPVIALFADGSLAYPGASVAGGGGLEAGIRLGRLEVRGAGGLGTPQLLADGRVERIPAYALLTLGLNWLQSGLWSGVGAVGLGATAGIATGQEVVVKTAVWTWSPSASLGLRLRLRATPTWHPWLGVQARLQAIQERYREEPVGVIGVGPWLTGALQLGLDWSPEGSARKLAPL